MFHRRYERRSGRRRRTYWALVESVRTGRGSRQRVVSYLGELAASEQNSIETTWYRGTALEDLLGMAAEKVHTDRLYEGLDWLLPHKSRIERHLKERLETQFDLEYELLLYDVTSSYFEGQCAANGLAKRGYSRDSRPDCLQVCIGLALKQANSGVVRRGVSIEMSGDTVSGQR